MILLQIVVVSRGTHRVKNHVSHTYPVQTHWVPVQNEFKIENARAFM